MSLAPSRTRKNCPTKRTTRDGCNADGKQRECTVNERGYDCHETGDGYLESRGPSEQAGVGKQCDVGTAASGPIRTVDAAKPNIWPAQPTPPITAAYVAIPPMQQRGLPQDFQTSSDPPSHLSSGSHEAGEAEEVEDVGAKATDEEATVTRGRWHLHGIHRPDLDSKPHQQLH